MTTNQAAKILIEFNRWRRSYMDKYTQMPDPKEIGQAIDKAVEVLAKTIKIKNK